MAFWGASLLPAPLTSHGFTISVLVAVAIAAPFALVVPQSTRDGKDQTEVCR